MIARPVWVSALLVAALTACGDSGPAADAGGRDVASSEQSPGSASSAAALLTVDDLPEGWSQVPDGDSEGGSNPCLDELSSPGGPLDPGSASTVTFAAGEIGPFLAAAVIDRAAGEVLPEIDRTLVACDGTTSPEGFATSITPTVLSGLPDGSLAVQGTDTARNGSTIRYTIASAGTDQATAFVLALTPLGEIDDTVVASAVDAMHRRLPGS